MALFASLLWACNSGNKAENASAKTDSLDHEQGEVAGTLALNNGAKWKADSITHVNVAAFESIIDNFEKAGQHDLPAYAQLAGDLQKSLNKLITDCKMQGPDHEALHLWLQPLLQQVAGLAKATTTNDAANLFNEIKAGAKLYSQYFE